MPGESGIEYEDFNILVNSDSMVTAESNQGEISDKFSLDVEQIENAFSSVLELSLGSDFLASAGTQLFNSLFPQQISNLFYATLANARARNKGVRIRLTVEPQRLLTLPWEFAYEPTNGFFVASSTEIVFSRYIPTPMTRGQVEVTQPPIRVLVVISNPSDLGENGMAELDVAEEIKIIESALRDLTSRHVLTLSFLTVANTTEIRSRIRRENPHIFHFVGHGGFSEEVGGAILVLEDENRHCKYVSEKVYREFFLGQQGIKLVLLSACESAKTSSTIPFLGMAHNIVRRGLPAVIAMQYSIPILTNRIFVQEFYRSLTDGYPVDTSVQEARRAIYQDVPLGRLDFGIPVLFMRAPNGVIWAYKKRT